MSMPVIVGGLLLAGCSGTDEPVRTLGNPADVVAAAAAASSDSPAATSQLPDSSFLESLSSRYDDCDALGQSLGPLTTGLSASAESTVSPDTVHCAWDDTDSGTSVQRSLELTIRPGTGDINADQIQHGLVIIPDERIDAAGGIARSMSLTTSGTSLVATEVQLPQVSLSLTAESRDSQPMLDGTTAVNLAKQLLGL